MPINNKRLTYDDGLEKRIKNHCYDIAPKDQVRNVYAEPNQGLGMIYPGAKFVGFQSSNGGASNENQRYEVTVQLQDVNLLDSCLCGYLNISNLTTEFPELTTFFEAEIIGDRHAFLTRKWDADEDIDRSHWTKFTGFTPNLELALHDSRYKYDFRNERFVFMRWKELFLVPDHKIGNINGASYEGFYYICADLQNETMEGFYYHHSSSMFQRLDLNYIKERRFQSFEFR